MISLPSELLSKILNYFRENLYSFLLVNRQWCHIIIPILWSKPMTFFKDKRLIRILLLSLNIEEQVLLIPFKLTFPRYQRPLIEYSSYITSVTKDLFCGI
ncbi:hypothetical protein F8M41_017937 [Gigaspora margarita]|uniref:F-box domain-containing protein n=1 Tax=Gigaspora margarita TaxID=4874 RepID=A0A8H4B2X6_GIGMA|nr:hypothetical protein F8M41_017937 [Gigaspora margarita]